VSHALVLAGGGLANCLIAWRLVREHPDLDLVLVEAGERLGGNHTWSFHGGDLDGAQHDWIAPLVAHSWPCHEVRFPSRRRRIDRSYHSVSSERVHEVLTATLGDRVRLGSRIESLAPGGVVLDGGERIAAEAVLDGRGDPRSQHLALRFQKFLGREVVLNRPHGLEGPILMDATVEQTDGYRFVYVLPFGERHVLIEDTYYSDVADLPREALRRSIDVYARAQGWGIVEVVREEAGVLPILLAGDPGAFWRDGTRGVVRVGMRAALFHPTTGYSLPEAVRLADVLARHGPAPGAVLDPLVRDHALAAWRRYGFFRMLNRMMFLAGTPARRYRILERFYGLPAPLIERFYAGRLSMTDHLRLLTGKPPVPLGSAMRAVMAIDHRSLGSPGSGGGS
jgi:lycopene beta-cyclase